MSFESYISPREFVIDDSNYLSMSKAPPNCSTGYHARDFAAHPWDSSPVTQPFDIPLITGSELDDRIEIAEQNKSRLSDIYKFEGGKTKNQDGWGYCWIFATTHALEVSRAVQGQPYVELSASSAGLIIKNYRNQGGWGGEALEYLAKHGCCPVSMWPEVPSGASVRESAETKAEKLKYRVTEWYEIRSYAEVLTCLVLGIPVSTGHNWWGHQICQMDAIKKGGQYGSRILNSWGEGWGDGGYSVLMANKARPDGVAVAPRSITIVGADGEAEVIKTLAV